MSFSSYRNSYQSYLTRQGVEGEKLNFILIVNAAEGLQKYMKRGNMQTVFNKLSPLAQNGPVKVVAQTNGTFYRLPAFTEDNASTYMKSHIYGKDASRGEKIDLFSRLFTTSELTNIIWFTDEEVTPYLGRINAMSAPHLFWNFISIKGYPLRCTEKTPKNVTITHVPKISSLATSVLYRKVLNKFTQYVNKTDLPLSGRVRAMRIEDRSGSQKIVKGSKTTVEQSNLKIGIGWKTGEGECLTAAMLLKNSRLPDAESIAFFGNKSTIGTTHVDGRELPTEDMEQYTVNLAAIGQAGHDKVLFTLVMPHGAPEELYIRVLTYDNRELLRYDVDMDTCAGNTALELGALYAYKEEWRFNAIGNGYNAGMEQVAANYGIPDLTATYSFTPAVLEEIALDGRTFEYHMQELFTKLGYEVEVPTSDPYAPDYGVDLIIIKSGVRKAVQLKCFSNVVPVRAVQEVYAGANMYDCQSCMVVATSYFSRAALQMAEQLGVEIWDKAQLDKTEERLRSRIEVSPEAELKLKLSKLDAEDEVDIDVSAFLVNEHDRCAGEDDFIFYNQPDHPSGCVRLINDNVWEKLLILDLAKLPAHCTRIVIVGSLDTYKQKVELTIDNELDLYHTFEYMPSTVCDTLVLGQFRKIDGEWAFTTSETYFAGGLEEACRAYGLEVG
ncbi:TerD family protein [Saccharibacillus sp. CPCC 101409]|uniref:TerD family protein n=1 Tax=Saccharibacillus sp. CPCC 101409 TaxID=3058041 RepID=UPI0026715B0F|nr:TerD family protein [Saccharibacillus sp. CPCC 101409]MDO3412407.1 TerD family protein [Saccharibacillus sp. CPCC 101409]